MSEKCSQIHAALQVELKRLLSTLPRRGVLLDIGCWDGVTTMDYQRVLDATRVLGVEGYKDQCELASAKGIEVRHIDIEKESFGFDEESVDVVVCNQVFEHLKQVFHPMDEIWKALKPGGYFLFSVPNLASFHNRLFLLLGIQPSSIRVFGPHVRGFTIKEFIAFSTFSGNFHLKEVRGVGFYPFSANGLGNIIGGFWTDACHTPILLLQKPVGKELVSWNQRILESHEQTLF